MIQWFQYRAGVVLDSLRVAHCAAPSESDEWTSLCRRKFHPEVVEEVSEPDRPRVPGMAAPLAPCVPCLFLMIAATNNASSIEEDAASSGRGQQVGELPAAESR